VGSEGRAFGCADATEALTVWGQFRPGRAVIGCPSRDRSRKTWVNLRVLMHYH